ncbi:MAG: pentapeptide repeat-containing protein [Saprospiraceae bacterium]
MKEKRNLLVSIGLGAILGWTLGFLRLPFLEKNFSFLLGFIACLSIVSLGLLIIYIWRKNSSTPNTFKKNTFRSMVTLSLILAGGFASSFLFFQQNKFSKIQEQQQHKKSAEQFELEATTRKSNSLILMNNLFDKIEDELENNPNRKLSDEMIERIAALNFSFKPYKYFDGEKFSKRKWSPERGQLLLSLTKMKIDSSSFNHIKLKTSFLGADLVGANLSGADLSGIDLRKANLENAILQKINLNHSNLREINLWGADLKKADLKKADLKRANMQWCDLGEARLDSADLDDANLTSAKLRKSNLSHTKLRWGEMIGAFLNEANLEGMDLLATNLERANLSKANLSKTNLRWSILTEANLTEVNLTDVVDLTFTSIKNKNWLKDLDQSKVIGAKKIQKEYEIIKDKSKPLNYHLKKIKQ